MNASVAPTSRMMEISRARCSTVIRIVTPMMTTATAANASPMTRPTNPARFRSWSSRSIHSRPKRTSSTKEKPSIRSATAAALAASRILLLEA